MGVKSAGGAGGVQVADWVDGRRGEVWFAVFNDLIADALVILWKLPFDGVIVRFLGQCKWELEMEYERSVRGSVRESVIGKMGGSMRVITKDCTIKGVTNVGSGLRSYVV